MEQFNYSPKPITTMSKVQIVSVRPVKGGKMQLELAETKLGNNPLGILNASDERFTQNKRRAWITVEAADAKKHIPALSAAIDAAIASAAVVPVNIENPMLFDKELRVQIKETLTPQDEYQSTNIARSVKINPSTGNVLLSEGQPIFSRSTVVLGEPKDETIKHDSEMSMADFEAALKGATATSTAQAK